MRNTGLSKLEVQERNREWHNHRLGDADCETCDGYGYTVEIREGCRYPSFCGSCRHAIDDRPITDYGMPKPWKYTKTFGIRHLNVTTTC